MIIRLPYQALNRGEREKIMNKVMLIGRLTKDPDIRYANNEAQTCIARYTLAVQRNKDEADFISCVAFSGAAEFAEKYLAKGMKIGIVGHLQSGSYKNQKKETVYTLDVVVESHEFCEQKKDEDEEPEPQKNDRRGSRR